MYYRPVWAEVDLDRIARNVRTLVQRAYPQELMAVVKANGYGHGAEEVARVALASGARRLAVASPEEGRELRRAGIAAPILVLGALLPGQVEPFLEYRLTATIASEDVLAEAASVAVRNRSFLRVHLKVDTGMSRLGFRPDQIAHVVTRLRRTPGIELEGVFTHLACADGVELECVNDQLAGFRTALAACSEVGWRPDQVHLANTAGVLRTIRLPECNIVRVGIGMYGYNPCADPDPMVQLEPAMQLKSRVATVKRVPGGTGVSYGHTYTTTKETTLVTLPIGYADGVNRRLGGKAQVLIRGRRYPLVGRVCMDQCIVDVGNDTVSVGDEAVLFGWQGSETVSADEWAEYLDTIPYEVLCSVSARVPRVYRGGAV